MRYLALLVAAVLLMAAPASAAAAANDVEDVRYRVARAGVGRPAFEEFRRVADRTLTDERGWGADGVVAFRRESENFDFTLWLASPAAIAAIGVGCSEYYSCRVGDDVYINAMRWRRGADSYRDEPLAEYRAYVINHEVGHWLGLGHRGCPREGAASPVMQQQSKGLRGCEPQAWPLPAEQGMATAQYVPRRWRTLVAAVVRVRGAIASLE